MKIKDISSALEAYAPLNLQESYDNSGLLIGSPEGDVKKALLTLDVTNAVLDEAIGEKCQLVIAHHPLIFNGIKRLTGKTSVEKLVVKAIKNNIAIYAIHTNLDNVKNGVNGILADKLGLCNTKILSLAGNGLKKLVTFCPVDHAEKVRNAIFNAGAGHIGNYDNCSYNISGEGTFRALEDTDPFVGKKGKLHFEKEVRIETIIPEYKMNLVLNALLNTHPYEEVAYDIYPLENLNPEIGAGVIGELKEPIQPTAFLKEIKSVLNANIIRYNSLINRKIKKAAICGGSGSFLIKNAFNAGADIFVTGDIKYHDFFEFEGEMTIADAGHYETEQFTKELLYSILKEKFPTFALLISKVVTNPVNVL
jgi:dinuclear metal center YbgI/SA1388 family protein